MQEWPYRERWPEAQRRLIWPVGITREDALEDVSRLLSFNGADFRRYGDRIELVDA